jgi:tRNA(Phe) wybutosine-synthesizing methylase Tyw3
MKAFLPPVQEAVDAVKAAEKTGDFTVKQDAMTDLMGLIADSITRQASAMERIANALEEKYK